MKRAITAFVLILVFSLALHAEDMQKYLSDTEALARDGKYQEALERFLWFHDHVLEHEPAMYGVRLSFALSSWKKLGDVYPPALAAFKKTRDEKTELLIQKKGSYHLFHDVQSLNETLEEDARTVELFRTLDREQPDLAKECWQAAQDAVIAGKNYDLAKKYIGDLVLGWNKVKNYYETQKDMYDDARVGKTVKKYNEQSFIKKSLQLIEVALALDDMKTAKEIQAKSIATIKDKRLKNAIK